MTSGLSERRSCALAGIRRSSYRYVAAESKDTEVVDRIRELAVRYPRFGYRRIWALLERTGLVVNRKRVWRLWKESGLALKRRPRRKRVRGRTFPGPLKAAYPRHVVTYDFVADGTVNGRRLKLLTIVDEYTRESLAIAVGYRMTAEAVMLVLLKAFETSGWPEYLRSDNGPEFVAERLQQWLRERGVRTHYIDPASPWQNAYGESFNEKLRTECLSLEAFFDVPRAQEIVEAWRVRYNLERPHSSLGYRTPAEVYEAWERTRKELSFSPAPGSPGSPLGEAGEKEKLLVVG